MNAIKELIHEASQKVSHYWPMTTFVHHNPIRSLETYQFDEAVEIANRFIGGQGYLSNQAYRELFKQGRIEEEDLNQAIAAVAQDKEIQIGKQKLSHAQVLKAQLLKAKNAPKSEPQDPVLEEGFCAWLDKELGTELLEKVNLELIKWIERFLDEGLATWYMPQRDKGFYTAWKSLAAAEWSSCGIENSSSKIKALPKSAEAALEQHLDQLAIPQEKREDFIAFQLTSLYGWASYINWRAENNNYEWQAAYPIDLTQYLAVRLFYERELAQQSSQDELGIQANYDEIQSYIKNKSNLDRATLTATEQVSKLAEDLGIAEAELSESSRDQLESWLDEYPESKHGQIWLRAYEAGYQKSLLSQLKDSVAKIDESSKTNRSLAQLMFCIDVRSEAFRRNLEATGNFETLGFAGFFGIAIKSCAHGQHHETDQCPAIVQPQYRVKEEVRELDEIYVKHSSYRTVLHMFREIFRDLKYQIFSPYIMVESLGWLFGLQILERSLFPGLYHKWRKEFHNIMATRPATAIGTEKNDQGLGLSQNQQNTSIETALRTMGLVDNFARFVVVTGHTSMSDNNPYEAALNCGACGGNSGEPNARLFAALANKKAVREHLAKNGIEIPEDTHFIGAVHNTTTDAVDFYDLEDLPESHEQDFEELQEALKQAAARTNLERCYKLPGTTKELSESDAVRETTRRSGDWSETRPEWGLSGNAAFIIGRRALTQDLNLEGRSFLNSHDYRLDSTGALLEGILMGPMVVGQWINAEHYFSATDPEVYGSGSKIYHNIVGKVAIMSGPQSDLRTGLALESVANGNMTYHEPLRLSVIIEAPRERIAAIIEKQAALKQLCKNEWIHLIAIDHDSDNKFYLYQAEQKWQEL